MSQRFAFSADGEAAELCDGIVDEMIRLHGVSRDEAIGRVNRAWNGVDFKEQDVRFHEVAAFWANEIYFGPDSYWWLKPEGLEPLPYP